MTAAAKSLLTILAVLAVACAQVAGIGRGYVCDCTGENLLTDSPQCIAAECHPDQGDCDHRGTEGHEAPVEHKKATEQLQGVSVAPIELFVPAPVFCELPPVMPGAPRAVSDIAMQRAEARPPPGEGTALPASVLVARTMVMLV